MSAFYTFLSSLYNWLLKFISLIILLGEVLKNSEEVQSHPRRCAPPRTSPKKTDLGFNWCQVQFKQDLNILWF